MLRFLEKNCTQVEMSGKALSSHTVWTRILSMFVLVLSVVSFGPLAQAQRRTEPVDDLRERIAKEGQLQIIVRFSVPGMSDSQGFITVGDQQEQQALDEPRRKLLDQLAVFGVKTVKQYKYVPALAFVADLQTYDYLSGDGSILLIQEDELSKPSLAQSTVVIGANIISPIFGGAGQTIVILDTGIDGNNPVLKNRIVAEGCFSSFLVSGYGVTSECTSGLSVGFGPGSAAICGDQNACWHGNQVALIANAVAPEADIIAIKVFSRFNNIFGGIPHPSCIQAGLASPCLLSYTSDQIHALQTVWEMSSGGTPIAAVNMSLGGSPQTTECNGDIRSLLFLNLQVKDIATIVASGNDGMTNAISKPACVSFAISVGSTGDGSGGTTVDVVSGFSNSAWFLDFLAPGASINTGFPGGTTGTSFAAPHVAGAWAVLKAIKPQASVYEIQQVLSDTGVPVTDAKNGITKPRINLFSAAINLGNIPFNLPKIPKKKPIWIDPGVLTPEKPVRIDPCVLLLSPPCK